MMEALDKLEKDGGKTLADCCDALKVVHDIARASAEKAKALGLAGGFNGALMALERYGENVLIQYLSLGIMVSTIKGHADMMGQDEDAWVAICRRAATIMKPLMGWDLLSHLLHAAAASPASSPTFSISTEGFEKGTFQPLMAVVIAALASGRGQAMKHQQRQQDGQRCAECITQPCPFGEAGLCEAMVTLLRCRIFLKKPEEALAFINALDSLAAYEDNKGRIIQTNIFFLLKPFLAKASPVCQELTHSVHALVCRLLCCKDPRRYIKQGLAPLLARLLELKSDDEAFVQSLIGPFRLMIQEDESLPSLLNTTIHSTLIKLSREHSSSPGILHLSLISIRMLCEGEHVPKLMQAGVVDVLMDVFKDGSKARQVVGTCWKGAYLFFHGHRLIASKTPALSDI